MATIRQARREDDATMLELLRVLHSESPRYRVLEFSEKKLLELLMYLRCSPDGLSLVADHDGDIVGMFLGLCSEHWSSEDLVANDIIVFVMPQSRGDGIAFKMIRQYESWAKEKGAKLIQLGISTGIKQDRTADFYRSIGLIQCSIGFEVKNVYT